MSKLLRVFMLIYGICVPASSAKAETTPRDTATFVSYCEDHSEACRLTVVGINNNIMINQLVGDHHGCSLPDPHSHDLEVIRAAYMAETKTILDWLRTNSAARSSRTDDAIVQAIKTLWPKECR